MTIAEAVNWVELFDYLKKMASGPKPILVDVSEEAYEAMKAFLGPDDLEREETARNANLGQQKP